MHLRDELVEVTTPRLPTPLQISLIPFIEREFLRAPPADWEVGSPVPDDIRQLRGDVSRLAAAFARLLALLTAQGRCSPEELTEILDPGQGARVLAVVPPPAPDAPGAKAPAQRAAPAA